MYSFSELREQVWKANLELPRQGLVIHTFGNVSGFDRQQGIVAIKPSGVPYEELTPDSIVLVDLDNTVVDSKYKPSSDTKTHIVLYKHFPSIGGVVHTHSLYATAWAQAHKPIPCLGTTHADYVRGDIPCTRLIDDGQICGDYEEETGRLIIERFGNLLYQETPMVLVAAHGPFTWGATPEKAVFNSVILEKVAQMALYTCMINPSVESIKQTLIDKHFLRKHGTKAYYGQNKP
jgi:L-ribulose-5-phosphate 4-epimerase